MIYNNTSAKVVLHAHPSLINGYFAVEDALDILTFEGKFYLGNVPVIKQQSPTVCDPKPVIEALKTNNLVVLKNHGTVAVSDGFEDALNLTEALEEAVRSAAIARIFKKEDPDQLDKVLKEKLGSSQDVKKDSNCYEMFCRRHIEAIVDLVNQDDFIAQKGKELDLTLKLAIKLDENSCAYKFNFEKGKIVRLDFDLDAPFVISAGRQVWEQVFLGKLDSFVAVTQGKMKLQGQLGQLSRWYVPFSRLFELFKQVKIKT
jgi:putative sterol carrier protein